VKVWREESASGRGRPFLGVDTIEYAAGGEGVVVHGDVPRGLSPHCKACAR